MELLVSVIQFVVIPFVFIANELTYHSSLESSRAISDECADKYPMSSQCPSWADFYCNNWMWKDWMTNNCKKSCNRCGGSGQTCAKTPSWMKNTLNAQNVQIINGQFAPSPIPWQVHLHTSASGPRGGSFICGGTILDEETILTAAHCFVDTFPDSGDFIEAGIRTEGDSGEQTIFIKSVINHPQYNSENSDNDISIVKLKTPLTFNNNVRGACLPESSFAPQSLAVVSGWGRTKYGDLSSALKFVAVPLLSNVQCVEPYTNYPSYAITSNMVCAGYLEGGKDSCQGDSGGPLVVPKSSSDDTAIIYGVVSWGWECAEPKQPGVYARVTRYLPWIKANMK